MKHVRQQAKVYFSQIPTTETKKSIDQESNYADSPITNTNETASLVTVTLVFDSVSINLNLLH